MFIATYKFMCKVVMLLKDCTWDYENKKKTGYC